MREWKSFRNMIQYLAGVYLLGWTVFFIVYLANLLGTLSFGSISHKLVLMCAVPVPLLVSYSLWKAEGVIHSPLGFIKRIFQLKSFESMIISLTGFLIVHFLVILCFCKNSSHPMQNAGLWLGIGTALAISEEAGWRGYLRPKLQTLMPSFLVSATLGTLWALWYLPTVMLDGFHQTKSEAVYFWLFLVFMSILLDTLAEVSTSIFPGILVRIMICSMVIFKQDLLWGNEWIVIAYLIEMIVCFVLKAVIFTKKKKIELFRAK